MKIIIANNPEALRAALRAWEPYAHTATVEAEYGDEVVHGSITTLAHHGPRADHICPCLEHNRANPRWDAIGISHVDLDTVGGIMALMGQKPAAPRFWLAAAYVDLHGPHRLLNSPRINPRTEDQMWAYWAFSDSHRVFAPRDGSAADVMDHVQAHLDAVQAILVGNYGLLAAGEAFRTTKAAQEKDSFLSANGPIAVRRTPGFFANAFYRHEDTVFRGVAAFNEKLRSVTISLADPIAGVSCREVVQTLWGPLAGGHDGIAGSPRGQEMQLIDAFTAAAQLHATILHLEEG